MTDQERLIEDLKHAHAHSRERLNEIAQQAAAEIARLSRDVKTAKARRSFWKRIFE